MVVGGCMISSMSMHFKQQIVGSNASSHQAIRCFALFLKLSVAGPRPRRCMGVHLKAAKVQPALVRVHLHATALAVACTCIYHRGGGGHCPALLCASLEHRLELLDSVLH